MKNQKKFISFLTAVVMAMTVNFSASAEVINPSK